jgi:DNA-binding transcriptional ArsR family regulator
VTLTEELITTAQAGRLVGRTEGAIRAAIRFGQLTPAARTDQGHHRLRAEDVRAWDASHRRLDRPSARTWERTAQALAELEAATADEIGAYLSLNPGNVRKHLLILESQGRVQRHKDGQWTLTGQAQPGAA